jgi:hypothetical protein
MAIVTGIKSPEVQVEGSRLFEIEEIAMPSRRYSGLAEESG